AKRTLCDAHCEGARQPRRTDRPHVRTCSCAHAHGFGTHQTRGSRSQVRTGLRVPDYFHQQRISFCRLMNPYRHICSSQERVLNSSVFDRREFLWRFGGGLGGIAMAHLLGTQGSLAEAPKPKSEFNGGLHHRAKAKRVVQLFMSGAASQCDTFDYKPALIERHGQKFDPGGKVELFQSEAGAVMKSPWDWKQHGACGKWASSLVPHIASCVDEIAFVHSLTAKSNVHGPATY